MFACEKGQEALVQHLLDAGASISCTDKASDVAQLLYSVFADFRTCLVLPRNTAMPIAFLEAQMSLRESFAESKALASQEQREAALMRIRRDAQDSFDAVVVRLAALIDRDADHAEAVLVVRALHFFEKFLQDLDR
jgi:hypothetical protein